MSSSSSSSSSRVGGSGVGGSSSSSSSSGVGGSSSSLMRSSLARSKSGGGSSSENLPPRTLARVAREVKNLLENHPEGVRLVVDPDTGVPGSLENLLAEIEGPTGTPYEGKYFQLKLVLSPDFPASPPRGFFLTKIYHPNVDISSGAICVNTLKKDWTSATTFSHVLSVVRCLLIVPFPESSLNDEAGKLFMDSYEEYGRRARLMADVHGRPRPFTGDDDGSDGDGGSGGVKKGGKESLDGADSPVRRQLKRGVSSPTSFSTSSSSMPQHSNRSLSSTSIRSNSILSRSSSVSSTNGSNKKLGTEGKVKKKKSAKNSLKRL